MPRIFLAEVTSPPHEELMKLITSCGGQVRNNSFCFRCFFLSNLFSVNHFYKNIENQNYGKDILDVLDAYLLGESKNRQKTV